jgi:hypothetical protein
MQIERYSMIEARRGKKNIEKEQDTEKSEDGLSA